MSQTLPDYRTEAQPQKPHRRHELTVHVGGDTWEDTIRSLKEAAEHIEDHGQECQMASGGVTSGYYVNIETRPDMTNEKYFEQLDAWQAHQKRYTKFPVVKNALGGSK